MVRPRIDDDGLKPVVEQYAEENGLKMPRAWGDLVRAGLAAESPEFLDDVDADDLEGSQ